MKREDVISLVIYFFMIAIAVIVGLTTVGPTIEQASIVGMNPFLAVILIILGCLLLNIIGLELLHMLGAKLGGYKIISVNFLGICFEKREGKTKVCLKDFDEDTSSPERDLSMPSSSFKPSDIDETIISEGTINNFLNVDKINILKDVVNAAGFDMDNTYLCLGKSVILMSDLANGKRINLDQSDIDSINNQQKAMHLMPAKEKWNRLQDFRNFRDQKNAEKLGKMTMAQYNALRYVDEGKNHKVNLTESQLRNIISETIRNILKQEKRH